VFEIVHIMPFLQKHKCNPVNSEPMRFKDLIQMNMSKNTEGKWHCPVTFKVCQTIFASHPHSGRILDAKLVPSSEQPILDKVFNDNSRICCVRPSGHVYAYEAVEELNVRGKNWRDLMTDAPFTREDIVMIQVVQTHTRESKRASEWGEWGDAPPSPSPPLR
jgi:peptidyl-prolyl cis-trans isomerase-like protein 2